VRVARIICTASVPIDDSGRTSMTLKSYVLVARVEFSCILVNTFRAAIDD